MGWRTKAGIDDTEAFAEDRLAIYDSTRVPCGRATGLPPVRVVRRRPDEAPEPVAQLVFDLRDWRTAPEVAPAVVTREQVEPAERFEPLAFESVVAASAVPEVIAPDAEPFEPMVFEPETPAPQLDDVEDVPVQDVEPRAARYVLRLPAAATFERSDATELGETGNVSVDGLLLHMPFEPPDTHLDLVVGDDKNCSLIWAKVVDHQPDAGGGFCWHLLVVSADDAWTALVDRAVDAAPSRRA